MGGAGRSGQDRLAAQPSPFGSKMTSVPPGLVSSTAEIKTINETELGIWHRAAGGGGRRIGSSRLAFAI